MIKPNSNSLANLNPGNRKGKGGIRRKVTKDVLEFFDDYLTSTRDEFIARMNRLSDVDFVKAYIDSAKFVGTKRVIDSLQDELDAQQSYQFVIQVHPRPNQLLQQVATEPETEATEVPEASKVSFVSSADEITPTSVIKTGTSFTLNPDISKFLEAAEASEETSD